MNNYPLCIISCITPTISVAVLKMLQYHIKVIHTLSEAIGSLGCRRNSSDGSMLIRQLTEPQLLTCSTTEESAGIPVHSAGYQVIPS